MTMQNTGGLLWQIDDAEATKTDGVFSATVVFSLLVGIDSTYYNMLPDVVAAPYIAAGILPIEGYSYPAYPFATVRSIKCKKGEGGVYTYTVEYSDKNSAEEKSTDENPLLDRPIIKPVAGTITRAITRDRDGSAILNSAGDPIMQTVEDNTIGFTITANLEYIPAWVLALRNTCNSSPIVVGGLTIGAEMARFILPSGWASEPKARNDISYIEFTYELQIDEIDKHYGRPLDAGFRALTGLVPEKRKTIVNGDGSEPSEPVLLDGEGYVLEDPTPADAVYLTVKKYPMADYSFLPGVTT